MSHKNINPAGIVPVGPEIEYDAEHGRDRLAA
jgi:putative glutathione S-transferase